MIESAIARTNRSRKEINVLVRPFTIVGNTHGGSWDILVKEQLMDQQFPQTHRRSHIIEAKVQAPVGLKPSQVPCAPQTMSRHSMKTLEKEKNIVVADRSQHKGPHLGS